MARKPNYQFERKERERAKAAKVADKAADRAAARQRERDEAAGLRDPEATPPDSES